MPYYKRFSRNFYVNPTMQETPANLTASSSLLIASDLSLLAKLCIDIVASCAII